MELVVARHLLGERPTVVLEHDEVAQQGDETSPLADARQHHLQLGCAGVGQGLAGDRPPGLEPLAARRERSNSGIYAVGDDQDGVHGEQGRQFRPVGLQLLPCGPDRGVLVARILHFDQAQRKAVDEQHDVGPALVVVLDDRELVGGEPVVVGGPLEVDDPRLGAPDRVAVAVLHRHTVDEHAVEGAVAGFERCARGTGQLAEGVVECVWREAGVEAGECASEPRGEHDFAVIRPFGHRAVGGDVGAVGDIPVEAEQPVEGRVFKTDASEMVTAGDCRCARRGSSACRRSQRSFKVPCAKPARRLFHADFAAKSALAYDPVSRRADNLRVMAVRVTRVHG